MTEKEVIEILLSRYLNNELDEKETSFIESWIKASEENRKEFDRIRRISAEQKIYFPDQKVQKARERIKTILLSRLISKQRKTKRLTSIFFILLIGTSSLSLYFANKPQSNAFAENSNYFSVKTGQGENSECTLPDSTHIWLNSNSEIRYQLKENGKLRSVEILGEAFFDVAKIKKVPFEVSNGNLCVKVFGTRFNFKANKSDIQVTLERGSLGIYKSGQNEIARLVPGVQAVVNQSGSLLSLERVDTKVISDWKTGSIEFKDESLEVIANQMSEIYGVNIKINNNALKNERFRCVINRKKSVLSTLELLKQTSDIDYSIKGSEIILNKRN